MIKIEISDIENLDDTVLLATGRYLIDLSNKRRIEDKPRGAEGTTNPIITPEYPPVPEMEVLHTQDTAPNQALADAFMKLQVNYLKGFPPAPKFENPETEELNKVHPYIPPAPPLNIPSPPSDEPVLVTYQPPGFENEPAIPSKIFSPTPQVELDIHGMPWDIRIHARTKTKMKDGSWKKLRGVGPATVKTVEAQLTNVQNIPAPPPSALPATESAPGFTDLMTLVTKAITEGRLRRDQVTEVLKPFGVPSLPLVSTRLDLIPAIMAALNGVINAPC